MSRSSFNETKFYNFAHIIAKNVEREIEGLGLPGDEWRRDRDGVSQDTYLLAKLVGEILIDGRLNLEGLEKCTDE